MPFEVGELGQVGCRICVLFCAWLSLVSWHWSVREITARSLEEWLMSRCGDVRCTVSFVASQALLCSALVSGQRWEWCTFGRRWSLPEVQGGSRESHAPLVVLPGKRAGQVSVELIGPCSCQFPGFTASHTCACRNPAGRLECALPRRVRVSLELLVLCC